MAILSFVPIGLTVLAVFVVASTVLVIAGPMRADRVAGWLQLGAAFTWHRHRLLLRAGRRAGLDKNIRA